LFLEVHRLSADNRYRPIIGQFADNRYRPFDNRHRPIIGIGIGIGKYQPTKSADICTTDDRFYWQRNSANFIDRLTFP